MFLQQISVESHWYEGGDQLVYIFEFYCSEPTDFIVSAIIYDI